MRGPVPFFTAFASRGRLGPVPFFAAFASRALLGLMPLFAAFASMECFASAPDSARAAGAPDSSARARRAAIEIGSLEDTLGFRLAVGAGTDVTNEQYYEDAFVDTTFLGRRLVSTPEARYAGILSTTLQGTRGGRSSRYELQNELHAGDLVQRDALWLRWRTDFGLGWRARVDPSLEYRRDRTFDRDRREWRGSLGSSLRRAFEDGVTAGILGLRGDLIRTSGQGTAFLLDRNSATGSVALDHLGLLGDEWRLEYRLTGRAFPDSSARDHLEHAPEARVKWAFGEQWLELEAHAARRQTLHSLADTSSRDRFWNVDGTIEASLRLGGEGSTWALRPRLELEAYRYDFEDSTLFFDYHVLRGEMGLRREIGTTWTVMGGPRGEVLSSRLDPGEGYQEIGAMLDLEYLGTDTWWNVTPAAGWRDYDEASTQIVGFPRLHSSYGFYELSAFADQRLAGNFRMRGITTLRLEAHQDAAEDARSIYLSLELRWVAR